MNSETAPLAKIGIGASLATLTLSEVNATLGLGVGLIAILCGIPVLIRRWRNLLLEYYVFAVASGAPRTVFSRALFRWLSGDGTKSKESGPPFTD